MKKIIFSFMALGAAVICMTSCNGNAQPKEETSEVKEEAPAPKKEKKTIVCRVVVKDGQRAAFTEVAGKLVEATRQEPGNVSYNLYQSPFDSTLFIFYEEYKDDAAFDAHANSDHFKAFAEAIPEMLAEELNIEQF